MSAASTTVARRIRCLAGVATTAIVATGLVTVTVVPAAHAGGRPTDYGVTDKSDARGLQVTAVRITLLEGSAAGTVVNLGNAKATIRES
jgi:hypothetical protein